MVDDLEKRPLKAANGSEYGSFCQSVISGSNSIDHVKQSDFPNVTILELFKYGTKLDWLLIVLGSAGAILNGFARPLMSIVFGRMTDSFLDYDAIDVEFDRNNITVASEFNGFYGQIVYKYAVYYIYFGLLVIFSSAMQYLCWQYACERQIHKIKKLFLKQVLRQEIAWFDAHKSGEFTTRLNEDVERIRDGIGSKLSLLLVSISGFVGGYIIGFIESWQLTLVLVIIAPCLLYSTYYKSNYFAKATYSEQEAYAYISAIAEEILSSIKTVWSLCGQRYEIDRYKQMLDNSSKSLARKYFITALTFGLDNIVLYGSYAFAYWYGASLVIDGSITAGSIFIIFLSVIMGSMLLGNAMLNLSDVATAKASAGTIFGVIERKTNIDPYSDDGVMLKEPIYEIKFEKVNFIYPSRVNVQVLFNYDLTIRAGQSVALCGGSGSGKSTIVALLQRFYDPTSGRITVNGVDIRDLNLHWWRSQIGIVSQEAVLFSGTIRENIALGSLSAGFDEIVKAAKKANAHAFIKALPAGYDTLVGERGAQLSGGQKQRIAIARAIIGDPKLLLLDEATSALDTVNEQVVQKALDKARKGRITLIVAHRLSTIKDADLICAMESGKMVEKGKHDDLVEKRGLYHALIRNQTCEQESSTTPEASKADLPNRTSKCASRFSIQSIASKGQSKLAEVDGEVFELAPSSKILKWCWYKWDKLLLVGYIIAAALIGLCMPLFSVIFASVAQSFNQEPSEILSSARFWSCMLLVLAVINFLGHFFRIICSDNLAEHVVRRLRVSAYRNVLRQDQSWHDQETHSTARISSKLTLDAPMIRVAAGQRSGLLVCGIVTFASGLSIAFYYGWILALALTALLPLLLLASRLEFRIQGRRNVKQANEMADAMQIAAEAIASVRTVQSLGREMYFCHKFNTILDSCVEKNKKTAIVSSFTYAFTQSLMYFVYAGGFCLGAYLVTIDLTAPADIYVVFFAMTMSAAYIGVLITVYPNHTQAQLSASLVFQLIESTSNIDNLSDEGLRPYINGNIDLTDVYFSYPTRKTVPVLSGLTVKVKAGTTLALVGESGCGKSTLIQLLMRFYDPDAGFIELDGIDIRDINIIHLRSHIGFVGQEPVLFSGTIAYNITYGLEYHVSQGEIESAAKKAKIHDFIKGLPQGYETKVGERGMLLSGGQKQRIAIARALVRKPNILLLDEATSALDSVNEKLVQEALDEAKEGRTCVVVAHRLSTIRNADQIAVVENGRIVEIGSHEELIQEKGAYLRLIERQQFRGES